MKSGNYPLSRNEKIVIQELGKEILLYDLITHRAFCLNQTSAMVWKACDGTRSVTEISQDLSRQLKSNVGEDLVWFALKQLKADDLLEDSFELVTPLDNLSRREAVRRVGLASMIMLPVISALVAPTAVNAQSGSCFPANNSGSDSAPGCACVGTFDCCGICSATNVCTGAPRGGSGADPGAAPSCFSSISCSPANNSGSDSPPGCPCIGTFDCCGICSATGFCTGPSRPAAGADPGAAFTCP